MEIKRVNIDKLKPFEGNPKKHPPSQIDKIIKSFGEYGWTNPILATKDNMIVAGHARVEAAKKAKIKEVPVIYLPFDGKKAMAYAIADNKLAELAETDFSKLADLLSELDDGSFDLELTGYDKEELEEIANWTPPPVVGDDNAPLSDYKRMQPGVNTKIVAIGKIGARLPVDVVGEAESILNERSEDPEEVLFLLCSFIKENADKFLCYKKAG